MWKGGEEEARTEARAAQESGLEISTHRRHLPRHGPDWECPTRMHGLTGAEVQGGRRKEAGGKSPPGDRESRACCPAVSYRSHRSWGFPESCLDSCQGRSRGRNPLPQAAQAPQAGLLWNFLEMSHYPRRCQHAPEDNGVQAPRLGWGPCSLVPIQEKGTAGTAGTRNSF